MAVIDWTEQNIERLKRMRAEGMSCGKIAVAFGDFRLRNAIIGKCSRMNIPTANRPSFRNTVKRATVTRVQRGNGVSTKTERAVNNAVAKRRHGSGMMGEVRDPTPLRQAEPVGSCAPRSLMERDLVRPGCAWIVSPDDAPEPLYCASERVEGRSWCEAHCALGFAPVQPSKRIRVDARWG